MASTKQLRTPPIKEAIINVSFKDVIDLDRIKVFCNDTFIKGNYPRRNDLNNVEFNVSLQEQTSKTRIEGFILNCENACNKSIQIKIGQLSFHNTNEYVGWDNFYEEFKIIWGIFCETIGKMDLINISVRYINQLHFDLPLQNGFEEYLKFLPIIPEGISRSVNSFFIQLNVPNHDNTMTGIITETFGILPTNKLQVILDLIVLKAQNVVCNSEDMWSSFASIRDFKNQLFFSSLTDKTISFYE
jgi:uncharacterized protein (TIGR04255 family)